MSRFVRQEETHLEVGPQQLALAVSEGDMGQLTLAMRAASSMWGGRRFPILAVTESGGVAAGGGGLPLLDTMDATTVIDFSGRLVAAGEVRSEDGVRVPVVPAQPLEDAEQWSPPPLVGFALDELKGMRMFEAATEDPAAVAAIGRLACREELATWASFGADVQGVTDEALFDAQVSGSSAIDVTVRRVPTTMAEAPFARSIVFLHVLGDVASFEDLLLFWNLRAMRPGDAGTALLLHCDQVLANTDRLVDLVERTAQTNPSLSVASASVPVEELRELRSAIGIPAHEGGKWTEQLFGGQVSQPTAGVNTDPRPFWTGKRHVGLQGGTVAALYEPQTTVTFENPFPFASRFFGVPVELRLRSRSFDVPRRPAVAELFLPGAGWAGNALRRRNGLSSRFSLQLGLPEPEQVLAAAVELPFTQSDKARQLRAVVQRDGVPGLGLYRDPVVVSVIETLTPSDSRQLKSVLAKLDEPDRDFVRAAAASLRDQVRTLDEVTSGLKPPGAPATAQQVAAALTALVDRGHVQRGVRADCKLCDARDLRQLDDAPAAPTCRACGAQAAYASGGRGEPALYYRLSPVMRLTSANGGLPVLAAAAVLQDEGAHLVPGVNGDVDGEAFEVDLLGWGGSRVLAGEVKRQAAGFTSVANDVRNSARFGADVHVAATLGRVGADLRAELEAACASERVELRVLDAKELLITGQLY